MARPETLAKRNARVALICGATIAGMVGVAFASVPLYRVFCQITGYGGTPTVDKAAPGGTDRAVTVRFSADTDRALPWRFKPGQKALTLTLGEEGLAYFQATNQSDRPIIGTATFNVTPLKAAQYFAKIECFCFTKQRLEPGETMDMPVTFYVDPALAEDENTREVTTLTLGYTFFEDAEAEERAGLDPKEAGGQRQTTPTGG
jgi:cytochrome c oxidase assembly protein subunit 11